MMRRCWLLTLMTVWVAGAGCAGTSRRPDVALADRPWAQPGDPAAAPAQRQVSLPPERSAATAPARPGAVQPEGLSKYFPGLQRDQGPASAESVAASPRPSRFGPGRRAKSTQTYTTDARSTLYRGGPEPSILPVSLRIPADNSSDRSVNATQAEVARPKEEARPPAPADATPTAPAEVETPTPPPPTDPVPPDVKKSSELPTVDPRERPRLAPAGATQAEPRPNVDPGAGQPRPTQQSPSTGDMNRSLGLPAPTLPPAYYRKGTGTASVSPQSPPPPVVLASPQSSPRAVSEVAKTGTTRAWKQNCFCRMVRKVCKIGEFAKSSTARPR